MTTPLKPRLDFDQPLEAPAQTPLQGAQQFDPLDVGEFVALSVDEQREGPTEQQLLNVLRPRRSLWRRLAIGAVALFTVSAVAQGVGWSIQAWQQQHWIELGSIAAGGLIVIAGAGSLLTEWRRLYKLRQQAEVRDRAAGLLQSHALGQGRPFCLRLASQAGIAADHPALQRWQASLHDSQSDREVVSLYARLVQPMIDRQVRQEISRSAAEATLMVAVSPLALVDMGFIAWRNLRLINRIAALYGIEMGYFSRLRLFKLVLLNIAFAGVSEWVREVGMDSVSQDLAARLSARAAQGMGAGLLTARLGIKAMELCRPLPWLADDKPRIGDFRRELLAQLKNSMIGSKKTDGQ